MTPHADRRAMHLHRSLLFMPASNARALEKAKDLSADGLVFDIEDAVAPDAKPAARVAAVAAAQTQSYGHREVLIRVNGLGTEWFSDDIAAVATSSANGIIVPKVNGPADVRHVDDVLRIAGAPESLHLWAMVETPRGVLDAFAIAGACPRLVGLIVGTVDLAKDLHCAHPADRAPMLYALQSCVLAARAAGVLVLDGVHIDLEDAAGFAAACQQGYAMGFDGKSLIHPKQIAVANAAFAPSAGELARAQRIVAAHREAVGKGQGVTLLDGRLVEALHVREAERLLARAAAIAELEGSAGRKT